MFCQIKPDFQQQQQKPTKSVPANSVRLAKGEHRMKHAFIYFTYEDMYTIYIHSLFIEMFYFESSYLGKDGTYLVHWIRGQIFSKLFTINGLLFLPGSRVCPEVYHVFYF